MSVWAIVLAAGSGSRFGGAVPKQYERLADRRVIDWSLDVARSGCDGVVLVVGGDRVGDAEPHADVVVAGGAARSDSVRAGMAVLPDDADIVVVHDGARPLASSALYAAVIGAVRGGADGAIPGIEVTDTIKRVDDGGVVVETPDRASLVAVQTPQAFRRAALVAAHATGGDATDDAALVEADGGRVVVVPGETTNFKITRRDDLDRAAQLLTAG
jgi:2-C-methyl-D-erythritol 4-phosphate cytidylyltransferase